MAKEVRRLGRGLNSLISSTVPDEADALAGSPPKGQFMEIPIDKIEPNPYQPRLWPQLTDLGELVQSIRQVGVLQPVTVRRKGEGYQLITGERRWRAAGQAGLEAIPAILREVTDEQMLEEALIENIQREDLSPIDRAEAYRRYCDEFKLSVEDVADRVGESRAISE